MIPFLASEPPGAGPLPSSLPLPTSLASLLINIESGRRFGIEGQCPVPSPPQPGFTCTPQSPRVPLIRLCLIPGDIALLAAASFHLSALSGATGPPEGWHPCLLHSAPVGEQASSLEAGAGLGSAAPGGPQRPSGVRVGSATASGEQVGAGRTQTTKGGSRAVCPVNLLGLSPGPPALPQPTFLLKALWYFVDATGREVRQSRKSLETLRPAPHSLLYFL